MKIRNLKIVAALFVLSAFFASCEKDEDKVKELTQKEKIASFLKL